MSSIAGNADVSIDSPRGSSAEGDVRDIRDLFSFGLWRAVIANDRIANKLIKERFGLVLPEWRVLGAVAAAAPARFGDVLDYLRMDKGQCSRIIKGLAARGLIASEPDPDDQRRVTLALTPMGRDLHDRVLAFAAARNRLTMDFLSEDDARTLVRILHRLTPAIERSLAELEGGR